MYIMFYACCTPFFAASTVPNFIKQKKTGSSRSDFMNTGTIDIIKN